MVFKRANTQLQIQRMWESARLKGQPNEEQRRKLERLRQEAEKLQDDIQRMSRRLKRLTAERASQSTARAADRLSPSRNRASSGDRAAEGSPSDSSGQGGSSSSGDSQSPSGRDVRQAEQDLEDAAQQLAERRRRDRLRHRRRRRAERRQRAEQDLARQQLARLETALQAIVQQQQRVLDDTRQLHQVRDAAGQLNFAQSRTLIQLTEQQQSLAAEVEDFADLLGGLGVFRLALSEAKRQMQHAAELLHRRDTGAKTQLAQEQALERLKQIVAALEDDPQPQEDEGNGGGGGGGDGGGQQGPQLEVAELKLLRAMQADLNRRTRDAHQLPASIELDAELAAEQGRLAELVLEILSRDNEIEASDPSDEAGSELPSDDDKQLLELLQRLDRQLQPQQTQQGSE